MPSLLRFLATGLAALLPLVAFLQQPTIAAAQSSGAAACVDAHTAAQLLRREAKLLAARDELRSCAAASCPGVVRSDCVNWLSEVEAELPTIVLQAEDDAGVVANVKVTMDGKVVASELTGRELEVDPGIHRFLFEGEGRAPIEHQALIQARQKGVSVAASWRSEPLPTSSNSAPPVELPTHRPTPRLVYYLAGGAALGGIGFATFAALGKSEQGDLQDECSPFCSSTDTDSVKTKYMVSDISLGLGIASLVAAGIVYLMRPKVALEEPSAQASRVRWSFAGGRIPTGTIRF